MLHGWASMRIVHTLTVSRSGRRETSWNSVLPKPISIPQYFSSPARLLIQPILRPFVKLDQRYHGEPLNGDVMNIFSDKLLVHFVKNCTCHERTGKDGYILTLGQLAFGTVDVLKRRWTLLRYGKTWILVFRLFLEDNLGDSGPNHKS